MVVFAQVPPPEHGQSRMVKLALQELRADSRSFDVHHVNTRVSETLEDIGEGSLRKVFMIIGYLFQAIILGFKLSKPVLYYVPGPAKWSAVIRDWFVLAILRIFYRRVVFHWHAIGQGEWANGSERVSLPGPQKVDLIARHLSRLVLDEPYISIGVSEESVRDASAVGSLHSLTVCNGVEDPCPGYTESLGISRDQAYQEFKNSPQPLFRILFLSHGTEEKGLFDAINAIRILVSEGEEGWRYQVTLAGGISSTLTQRFDKEIEKLNDVGGKRLQLDIRGYLGEEEKAEAYAKHEIFLSPSRWESFGLTTVEAMAYGMHIVASASDGVKGVLPKDYQYISLPGDCPAFSQSLRKCCEDLRDGSADGIGKQLRSRFLKNFQLDSFSENLREALKTTCGFVPSEQATGKEAVFASAAIKQIPISVYLADQNPGYDRSYGISRMSDIVLRALYKTAKVTLTVIVSKTSQRAPSGAAQSLVLPWGTRRKLVRFVTDHFHPLLSIGRSSGVVNYFPKGYLPFLSGFCSPSVVTIHDTIIQYDKDHYPKWRSRVEYGYWALMLKHTLRKADWVLTVSESSKKQILNFMERHDIPDKKITVTYEPCAYDDIPQPKSPEKGDYVIHLSSVEPHKGTSRLVRWWKENESTGRKVPLLHLIGAVPKEVNEMIKESESIVKRPFLTEEELQRAYRGAKALILPSEIEGFGLPALEAYYLGTPVCFVRGTSVEEVLSVATEKGGMSLSDPDSLMGALDEVLQMSSDEVKSCGHKLREAYSLGAVSERMLKVFSEVSQQHS